MRKACSYLSKLLNKNELSVLQEDNISFPVIGLAMLAGAQQGRTGIMDNLGQHGVFIYLLVWLAHMTKLTLGWRSQIFKHPLILWPLFLHNTLIKEKFPDHRPIKHSSAVHRFFSLLTRGWPNQIFIQLHLLALCQRAVSVDEMKRKCKCKIKKCALRTDAKITDIFDAGPSLYQLMMVVVAEWTCGKLDCFQNT